MFSLKHPFLRLSLSLTLLLTGCAISVKPDLVKLQPMTEKPILRLGEVTETPTGSWAEYSWAGYREALMKALNDTNAKTMFANDMSNLVMNIDMVSEHEDDLVRLNSLAALSILTLGVIPLNYNSVWSVDCEITIVSPDGAVVAEYNVSEQATYNIWAMPWTPITLGFAGIRGDMDGRRISKRLTYSLADKIMTAVRNDYSKLASKLGVKAISQSEVKMAGAAAPVII